MTTHDLIPFVTAHDPVRLLCRAAHSKRRIKTKNAMTKLRNEPGSVTGHAVKNGLRGPVPVVAVVGGFLVGGVGGGSNDTFIDLLNCELNS